MKKFAFPLRSIATVRNLREMQARDAFSKSVHVYVATEQRVQAQRRRIAELEEILRSGRLERFCPADQASFMAAFQDETRTLTGFETEMANAKAAMEKAREGWMNARKEVRVIENLETKARRTWQRDVERETQNAMDDRACAAAARSQPTTVS
jgi:flagellar export protein FliJ